MDQFVVPQFIDVEDKIFGPITVRQFLILLGAGIVCFIAFRILELYAFILVLAFVGGGALVFAFVKVRGQSFHYFILNFIQTARRPGRRIWKKEYTNDELKFIMSLGEDDMPVEVVQKKRVQREHIRQLSLQVNTGGYYRADVEQVADEVDDVEIG